MKLVVVLLALLVAACGETAHLVPVPLPVSASPAAASPSVPGSAAPPSSASSSSAVPAATPAPPTPAPTPSATPAGPFTIGSTTFPASGEIPAAYTCDGADVSPELHWTGVPPGATSLLLIVVDRDAAAFAHWIALDLAPTSAGLDQGSGAAGAKLHQGTNDFGRVGWGGPCPPSGTHHYRFTLYALTAPLPLAGHPGITRVRAALANAAVLGSTQVEGWYMRP